MSKGPSNAEEGGHCVTFFQKTGESGRQKDGTDLSNGEILPLDTTRKQNLPENENLLFALGRRRRHVEILYIDARTMGLMRIRRKIAQSTSKIEPLRNYLRFALYC